ncbi:unnamed protein product [Prorocentrum cordatum]|uniref:DUF2867 domain-containing protein n=1 Tax=Prorocentrum cordatum TaxID=2364126 RepID=A0ABN9PB21_9DINO|nr:unnamed protein product [Polarella glacialis]
MQNPQAGAPSMMGGLGILQPTAPPPALTGKTPQWLHGEIDAGAYQRVALGFRMPGPADDSLERAVLERVLASAGPGPAVPLAFVLAGTPPEPMHWHGRAGAWLHTAFFSHRLARRARALAAASPTAGGGGAPPRLPLPSGVHEGQYVVAVHLRHFELPGWNLPGSYLGFFGGHPRHLRAHGSLVRQRGRAPGRQGRHARRAGDPGRRPVLRGSAAPRARDA